MGVVRQLVCRLKEGGELRRGINVRHVTYLAPREPRGERSLAKCELLVLDDFGLSPVTPPQARDLLEVIDDRAQSRSTVVASQFPIEQWHSGILDPTLADAILDRLDRLDRVVHQGHRLVLNGESMRKTKASEGAPEAADGEGA